METRRYCLQEDLKKGQKGKLRQTAFLRSVCKRQQLFQKDLVVDDGCKK